MTVCTFIAVLDAAYYLKRIYSRTLGSLQQVFLDEVPGSGISRLVFLPPLSLKCIKRIVLEVMCVVAAVRPGVQKQSFVEFSAVFEMRLPIWIAVCTAKTKTGLSSIPHKEMAPHSRPQFVSGTTAYSPRPRILFLPERSYAIVG